MTTTEDHENCHHVTNGPQICKIILDKFISIPCGIGELLRKVSVALTS